jgi:Flp pilus assembly protein TadG
VKIGEIHRDERGLVGKLAIVWILILALLGVAAVDTVSIALTTFKLSDIATEAASDGAVAYRSHRDATEACDAARASVMQQDPALKLGSSFCHVDEATGRVTVTLHATARTVLAGRVSFTQHYANVVDSETNGPSEV